MSGAPLRCLAPRPGARYRLLCLPYAGGGPATFRGWDRLLSDVEVWTAVLPGHPGRMSEPAPPRLADVAEALADSVRALPSLPLAIFGHSMGAMIALELAQGLDEAGAPPVLLCVSGRNAPGREPPMSGIAELPDDDFVAALRARYGGLPAEIVANSEIMEVMLPVLRADVAMLERHAPRNHPLPCPVLAFGGTRDRSTTPEGLAAWAALTDGPGRLVMLEGDHFFVDTSPGPIARAIESLLSQH